MCYSPRTLSPSPRTGAPAGPPLRLLAAFPVPGFPRSLAPVLLLVPRFSRSLAPALPLPRRPNEGPPLRPFFLRIPGRRGTCALVFRSGPPTRSGGNCTSPAQPPLPSCLLLLLLLLLLPGGRDSLRRRLPLKAVIGLPLGGVGDAGTLRPLSASPLVASVTLVRFARS